MIQDLLNAEDLVLTQKHTWTYSNYLDESLIFSILFILSIK